MTPPSSLSLVEGTADETGVRRRALLPAVLELVVDVMGEAVCVVDQRGVVVFWNAAAEDLTGYRSDQALGSYYFELLHPVRAEGDPGDEPAPLLQTLEDGERRRTEVSVVHRDGHRLPMSSKTFFVGGGQRAAVELLSPSLPRAPHAELERARKLAAEDPLTGLANRRGLEQALEQTTVDERVGLLMLDLDHFKSVNDEHGHQVGDQALRVVGATLSANLRPGDVAGRWGGEEFLVLLPNVDPRDLVVVADRLRALVKRSWVSLGGGRHLSVSASVGATLGRAGERVEDVVARADRLLYAAKHRGRDRVCHDVEPVRRERRFSLRMPAVADDEE